MEKQILKLITQAMPVLLYPGEKEKLAAQINQLLQQKLDKANVIGSSRDKLKKSN